MLKSPLLWLFLVTIASATTTFLLFDDWKRLLGFAPVPIFAIYLVIRGILKKKK